MNDKEKTDFKFKIGRVFTPSAPINKASLFAGRKKQITTLMNAISQRGQHAVLFGERGVGKTSLANILKELLGGASEFIIASTNCETTTNFKSLWTNIFNDGTIVETEIGMGFNPTTHTLTSSFSKMLSDSPSPEEIRQILQKIGKPTVIILDEIDRIKDKETTTRIADTIKTLSDHAVDCTLVLVGVADSLDKLIAEHKSIERALVQIQMPRMTSTELEEIIDKGLQELGMTVLAAARKRISELSHGLPHYTHSLALYAAQAAIDRNSLEISETDVASAIESAITSAQQSIITSYHQATSSPRGNLYAEVLLACALAKTDDLGYFPSTNVRAPMSAIMGKQYEIPAFSQHLNDFCEPTRGDILQKTGFPRRYRFRFVNPLMEPYVVMKGISKGLITAESLDEAEAIDSSTATDLPL